MKPIVCPETSVNIQQSVLRNIPEEQTPQVVGSLESWYTLQWHYKVSIFWNEYNQQ